MVCPKPANSAKTLLSVVITSILLVPSSPYFHALAPTSASLGNMRPPPPPKLHGLQPLFGLRGGGAEKEVDGCVCAACVLRGRGDLSVAFSAPEHSYCEDGHENIGEEERSKGEERGRKMADAWIRGWQGILAGNDKAHGKSDKHHNHDEGKGEREKRREEKNKHYCDADQYPEWAEERVKALPLAEAVKEGKPEKLGKGKQAKTLKTTFKLSSGETTVAVVKELKRDRNWQFFLHNEYVSLARISASASAPSEIPKVLAVFRDKAQVVVELFECKGDLYSLGHPKEASTALKWWKKLARAVAVANSLQVFHCDVNPSNVLVDETGERLLLVDWACSRQEASESTKVTNSKRGHYQPGEMMKGFVGPQTDVFGVAACLLWFLTGRTPMSKAISGEDGRQRTPESIASIVKEWLPGGGGGDLSDILFKALAEDVSERIASVDELMVLVAEWEGKHGNSL